MKQHEHEGESFNQLCEVAEIGVRVVEALLLLNGASQTTVILSFFRE